jgi:protein gp37
MSDLFQDGIPDDYVDAVARVMESAPWHTFQVLTKRSDLLRAAFADRLARFAELRHVWWGVSVEDRKYGLPRIDDLRATPAGVRFLSIEPLLEDLGTINLAGIHWVIVGGESGPGARPMAPAWVESICDQCRRAHVPFFFKQWGGVLKKRTGRMLNGRTYDEFPEAAFGSAVVPGKADRLVLADVLEAGSEAWRAKVVQLGRHRRGAA